jgi:nucleoside-diphosphate-sugar epimerase
MNRAMGPPDNSFLDLVPESERRPPDVGPKSRTALQTAQFSHVANLCYVDDLIDGLVRLMKSPHSVTGPINIGNPSEFTILQLASEVIDLTGPRSQLAHRPKPEGDPRQRRPDISKAQDVLDWAPRTPLKEGLGRTIGYFEGLLRDATIRESLVDPAST